MKTNYQQLEQKIQELQDEHKRKVNELQAEVDRLKAQEEKDKLPEHFKRNYILNFLTHPNSPDLDDGFDWVSTPQGHDYWEEINTPLYYNRSSYKVPDEAIIQLQKWVIMSYQQEFGQ